MNTPLHVAVLSRNKAAVTLILSMGNALTNLKNREGKSAEDLLQLLPKKIKNDFQNLFINRGMTHSITRTLTPNYSSLMVPGGI